MTRKLFEDTLNVLRDMKAELHGDIDESAIRRLHDQLERAIAELEAAMEYEDSLTALKVLTLIAAIVAKLPLIVQAIEQLTKK